MHNVLRRSVIYKDRREMVKKVNAKLLLMIGCTSSKSCRGLTSVSEAPTKIGQVEAKTLRKTETAANEREILT